MKTNIDIRVIILVPAMAKRSEELVNMLIPKAGSLLQSIQRLSEFAEKQWRRPSDPLPGYGWAASASGSIRRLSTEAKVSSKVMPACCSKATDDKPCDVSYPTSVKFLGLEDPFGTDGNDTGRTVFWLNIVPCRVLGQSRSSRQPHQTASSRASLH